MEPAGAGTLLSPLAVAATCALIPAENDSSSAAWFWCVRWPNRKLVPFSTTSLFTRSRVSRCWGRRGWNQALPKKGDILFLMERLTGKCKEMPRTSRPRVVVVLTLSGIGAMGRVIGRGRGRHSMTTWMGVERLGYGSQKSEADKILPVQGSHLME